MYYILGEGGGWLKVYAVNELRDFPKINKRTVSCIRQGRVGTVTSLAILMLLDPFWWICDNCKKQGPVDLEADLEVRPRG